MEPLRSRGDPDLTVATDEGNKIVPQEAHLESLHGDQTTPAPESTKSDVAISDDDNDKEYPCTCECSSSLWFGPTFTRKSDFPYQQMTQEGKRSSKRRIPWVRGGMVVVLVLVDHQLVTAEKAHDSPSFGSANKEMEGFGPLKAALRVICAVFADHESVRSQPSCGNSPLNNSLLGNRRCGKQDRYPPPTDNNFGRTFQLAPW